MSGTVPLVRYLLQFILSRVSVLTHDDSDSVCLSVAFRYSTETFIPATYFLQFCRQITIWLRLIANNNTLCVKTVWQYS